LHARQAFDSRLIIHRRARRAVTVAGAINRTDAELRKPDDAQPAACNGRFCKAVVAGPVAMPTIQGSVNLEVPARCEVHGISRPSADSEIRFEVWLPVNGWNGK
jgi:hypothetical protein